MSEFLPQVATRRIIVTSRLKDTVHLGYGVEADVVDEQAAIQIILMNARLRYKTPEGKR